MGDGPHGLERARPKIRRQREGDFAGGAAGFVGATDTADATSDRAGGFQGTPRGPHKDQVLDRGYSAKFAANFANQGERANQGRWRSRSPFRSRDDEQDRRRSKPNEARDERTPNCQGRERRRKNQRRRTPKRKTKSRTRRRRRTTKLDMRRKRKKKEKADELKDQTRRRRRCRKRRRTRGMRRRGRRLMWVGGPVGGSVGGAGQWRRLILGDGQ